MDYIIKSLKQPSGVWNIIVTSILQRRKQRHSLCSRSQKGDGLTPRQSACTSLESLQSLKFLVSPLQLLSLPCAHSLFDSELLQILPTKMFPFVVLISLNFSRLEGPGSLNSNRHLWMSEFSSPSLLPTLLPLCSRFLSLFSLFSPSISSPHSYRE